MRQVEKRDCQFSSERQGIGLCPSPTRNWGLSLNDPHAASRQVLLDAVAQGSVISWQHINLLGEYDFSDEKLRDSVGIRPQKLTP